MTTLGLAGRPRNVFEAIGDSPRPRSRRWANGAGYAIPARAVSQGTYKIASPGRSRAATTDETTLRLSVRADGDLIACCGPATATTTTAASSTDGTSVSGCGTLRPA